MAKKLGISVSHLIYQFQKQYKISPKAYWMRIRLRQAITQLTTTSDGIKEIATRFGYSPTWFGIWIKQETGKTPSEIRGRKERE